MLARPTASSGERRNQPIAELWGAEKLILQNERGLKCSEVSGMLISDPLGEGSRASSTNEEL